MILRLLPDLHDTAVMNMAVDLALLESGLRDSSVLLFRHYGWTEPAYTFGVSQSLEQARAVAGPAPVLLRRATGGGIVNHLGDWTYALLAPTGHELAEMKATASYRVVHAAVAEALCACGVPVALVPCPRESCGAPAAPSPVKKPGACFLEPEIYDVVRSDDGRKAAGAAQKRTRDGILFQGYVEKSACPGVDWAVFRERFTSALASACGARRESVSSLSIASAVLDAAVSKFSDTAWNLRR